MSVGSVAFLLGVLLGAVFGLLLAEAMLQWWVSRCREHGMMGAAWRKSDGVEVRRFPWEFL